MSQSAKANGAGPIVPAVHLEFIQNQTGLSEDAGIEEIEAYHRSVFLHHHAGDLERYQQQVRTHEERLQHLEARLADMRGKLTGLDRLIPVNVNGEPDVKPTLPWNLWDRCMFAVAALAVVGLVVFGVLNISFNLLESGLVTFIESPIRAYFWAALLPVGALAVKVGWDFLQSRWLRDAYLWTCLAVGIAGVLVWLGAYAAVYPTLSKTTKEHIESLSVFETAGSNGNALAGTTVGGAKWIDVITVIAQATAEIFLSALLGMYLTTLYTRHRPVRLAGNPLFTQVDEERRLLEETVARERNALAEARGGQTRLENQMSALLAYARSMFRKEAAQQRDQSRQKRQLWDQITEQLRTQLHTLENGSAHDRNHGAATTATSGRQNGQ
ncbi:MAG TPA: hypothetical protein VMB21_12765 [Candidatus Limnocylindria bacterium]|nr:hypothetical protein [Candidatus Limnocylindria bacterium]